MRRDIESERVGSRKMREYDHIYCFYLLNKVKIIWSIAVG